MWFTVAAAIVIVALFYKLLLSDSSDIFKKYGIRYIDSSPVIGKLDLILGRKTVTVADEYAYAKMGPSEKFCGIMNMSTPVVIVKDMELIKKVLIKDFDYFVDRPQLFTKDDGSLKIILRSMEGDEWKGVRVQLTPTFTSGKIRKMMTFLNTTGNEWVTEFTRQAKQNSSGSVNIEVMKAVNLYTVDVISNTAFGFSANVIKDPNSVFMQMVTRLSDINKTVLLKLALRLGVPKLSALLGLSILDMEALSYFEKLLEQSLKARMKGETKPRNDFLDLILQAKKGELKMAEADELNSFEKDAQIATDGTIKKQYLTDEVMIAQNVQFFFAGFSTTSNVLAFSLYALALYPDIQRKLREEVNKLVKEDGSVDYDEVGSAVYIDMFICEVLRKFPAFARLERVCVRDYRDPETGLVVPKGMTVGVPVESIHNDRKYYEHPDKFYPEHFTPEKKAARYPYAFLPFGSGPRNCIGMRFALVEVKSAIAHMVHGFDIEATEKTPRPLQGQSGGLSLNPPSNLELKLTPRKEKK